jgi:hypothetical protein
MQPTIVSYATSRPGYYAVVRELQIQRLTELGLPHAIRMIEPIGEWLANCRHKPYFIRQCLRGEVYGVAAGSPIMWLDVDCHLDEAPQWPQLPCTLGLMRGHNMAWSCGAILLDGSAEAGAFVDDWIARMESEGTPGEHGPLVRTVAAWERERGLQVHELGLAWRINHYMRAIYERTGPLECPKCGRRYDELVRGRPFACWGCGREVRL